METKENAILIIQSYIKSKKIRDDLNKEKAISIIQAGIKGKNIRDYSKFAIFFNNYKKKQKLLIVSKLVFWQKKLDKIKKK